MPLSPTTEPVDLKLVSRLFVRFATIYGQVWSNRFKTANMLEAAKREWGRDLQKYSVEQLEQALAECKARYELPPTLPQFLMLLKPAAGARLGPQYVPLPPAKKNMALGKQHVRELLKKLK